MLLNRLTTSAKNRLENEMWEYPNMKREILTALKKDFVIELTIDEAIQITRYLGSTDYSNIWKMFDHE